MTTDDGKVADVRPTTPKFAFSIDYLLMLGAIEIHVLDRVMPSQSEY